MFYRIYTQKINIFAVFEVEDQYIWNAMLSKSSSSYFLSLPVTLTNIYKTFR